MSPDITMCGNDKCKKKKTCYRFGARPDEMQSYANFKYPKDKCYIRMSNWKLKKEL